ncbi:hypothetical protein Kpol_1055p17 [Vanderwaltozyma polyspora DSM 70294]|uniref:Chromatin modification-related protein n=1 Tax=Vanderwaltozyma polyspora (strain ATCC 22028 / DSM 70294 / BCRC 21397 / CBS 2163 / NBRC 10782 / NRRL Y-8283 / UCD 57-17) TaxID=436907 RepID=A7TG91_VANPO|nr:uncharacterized protein Kpol_1055p17 [Vanderwaltozyma polyspora DSM 70294]EDO18661.1 hypothetical protein Kpol_1055p17 [Vanderwaltozyma polyspora DSM 70294]
MDPSSVLEQTVQDISNLQSEFDFLLKEIKSGDLKLYDHKKKYQQNDSIIHKYIKAHGSLAVQPDEQELYKNVKEELLKCQDIQKDKCILANTALFLVSKHLAKLEKNIEMLEEDGLLAPFEEEVDSGNEGTRASSVTSTTSEKKRKTTAPLEPASAQPSLKKRKQQSRTSSRQPEQPTKPSGQKSGTPVPGVEGNYELQDLSNDLFSAYNNNEDEEDKTLYCFCQSVSYGEMVACDGPTCKYEWFHYGCVNLKEPPKGAWYCPDCTQELAKNTLKRKRV